jgi:PAS domain S-box-containing protein
MCLFTIGILSFGNFNKNIKKKDVRSQLMDILITKKSQLEQSLYSRLYYTKGVAAYVTINPDIDDNEFQNLAKELIKNDSVISTMSLAKDCIIGSIYPYKGHEAAVGLDLLAHPKRKEIVDKTIKTKKTFVAGPVELVEGGIAFISYTPIFSKVENKSFFWGVTDIVIKRDELFHEVRLNEEDETFLYALRGYDGLGVKGDVFWGNKDIFDKDPVVTDISLPTGNWVLAAYPKLGWKSQISDTQYITYLLFFFAIIISFLIWLLVKAFCKIKAKEKELRAIFGSMQDIVIELNTEGRYINVAPTNESLLIRPANELIGKTVNDFFTKELANNFLQAINKCVETKSLTIIDYPLILNGKEMWFHARLSFISADRVMFVAHDNSEQIIAKEALEHSEMNLRELNATKDKFFSIIAHDLKGPLGSFMSLTDLLRNNYDDFSTLEQKELLDIMIVTSKRIYELLDNLLLWSRAQRGIINFEPAKTDLWQVMDIITPLLESNAKGKGITIENHIIRDTYCFFDFNMIATVFRNLINNSIKFSYLGGVVSISNMKDETDRNKMIIRVDDNGIGMPEEKIPQLFKIDKNTSTPGTNGEIGSGLGLILCKEFVEKNGGTIWLESKLNEGSTFYFSLPLSG